MIDASRSPRPLWKRVLTLLTLVALVAAASWLIWVKELHHQDVHLPSYAYAVVTSATRTG